MLTRRLGALLPKSLLSTGRTKECPPGPGLQRPAAALGLLRSPVTVSLVGTWMSRPVVTGQSPDLPPCSLQRPQSNLPASNRAREAASKVSSWVTPHAVEVSNHCHTPIPLGTGSGVVQIHLAMMRPLTIHSTSVALGQRVG